MNKRVKKGQESVEFVLISLLVFCASIGVISLFSNNISGIFSTDKGVFKNATHKTQVISANTPVKYGGNVIPININPNNTNNTGTDETASKIYDNGTYQLTANEDGSTTFSMNGTNLVLPKSIIDESNNVFKTTASAGDNELVKLLADMMTKYKDEVATGSEVNVSFGSSTAMSQKGLFNGSAQQSNLITVSIGDHYGIVQVDLESVNQAAAEDYKQRKIFLENKTQEGVYLGTLSEYDTTTDQYTTPASFSSSSVSIDNNNNIEELTITHDDLMLVMDFKEPNSLIAQ